MLKNGIEIYEEILGRGRIIGEGFGMFTVTFKSCKSKLYEADKNGSLRVLGPNRRIIPYPPEPCALAPRWINIYKENRKHGTEAKRTL